MSKVAKLVSYSFMTRVVVDEDATEDDIIRASKRMMKLKVDNELGENLEDIDNDDECPVGTFITDLPTIDRVILNEKEKQYIVIGKGLPTQIISFDNYSDWDSVVNLDGNPVFDIQIDEDDYKGDGTYTPSFQYVNLIWNEKQSNWLMGSESHSVNVEIVTEPLAKTILKLMSKN